MYTIKFADGTELTGLNLNGNNFVSQNAINSEFFTAERLAHVSIAYTPDLNESELTEEESRLNEEICGEFENMTLIHCTHYKNVLGVADGYYFCLTR